MCGGFNFNLKNRSSEQFLTGYETRYRAAVAAFNLWDDMSKEEWGDEHDAKMDELSDEYQVFGSLIPETRFEILETQTSKPASLASAAYY